MNTFLPANTAKMTTVQLIHACAELGVTVTITQLARWVQEELIPNELRQRHGLGRGNGTEWLWEAECLPRAVIIGRSLNHDRSLLHAARVLAEVGYAPSPSVLREVLVECVDVLQRPMVTRQTYISSKYPQEEQYRRFKRHMRKKTPDMPDDTFDPFSAYAAALLGLMPNDVSAPVGMQHIQQIFSLPSSKERLETIDASLLLAKYEDAGRLTPTFIPFIVGMFNEFLFPFAKQLQEKKGQDTTDLPSNLDLQKLQEHIQVESKRVITFNSGLGRLRLYLTIFLVSLPHSDEKTWEQQTVVLKNIVSGILEYLGFPSSIFTRLLEASKNDAPG
jgi:hypothetical protein